ncbi:unnamed protein product [Victoria cruziana]
MDSAPDEEWSILPVTACDGKAARTRRKIHCISRSLSLSFGPLSFSCDFYVTALSSDGGVRFPEAFYFQSLWWGSSCREINSDYNNSSPICPTSVGTRRISLHRHGVLPFHFLSSKHSPFRIKLNRLPWINVLTCSIHPNQDVHEEESILGWRRTFSWLACVRLPPRRLPILNAIRR